MILLDNNFRLEPDDNNWVLKYEKKTDRVTKKGEPITIKDRWYLSTLSQALKVYVSEATKAATNIEELREILTRIEKRLEII